MSWSLDITGGDISYGSTGLNTVTGSDKLVQDISGCILEPMGTDFQDPNFGSIIDGGVDGSGNVYQSLIGGPNDAYAGTLIQSEIQRVCQNYQTVQIARNQADVSTYGTSTLSPGEALLSVQSVDVTADQTTINVVVNLSTGEGPITLSNTF